MASSSSSALPPLTASAGSPAPEGDAPGLRPGPGSVVVAIGLLFLSPFAYVLWRNVDLGADLGEIIWDADTFHPLRRSLCIGEHGGA